VDCPTRVFKGWLPVRHTDYGVERLAQYQSEINERGLGMNALIVFQHGDWHKVQEFDTQAQADAFVQDYPRFGGDLSKAIRQGDWQIVEQKDKLTSRQVVAEEGLV
jgi:hypothetical protein